MLAEPLPRLGLHRDVWTNLQLHAVYLRRLLLASALRRPRQVLRSKGLHEFSVLCAFSANVVSQHSCIHIIMCVVSFEQNVLHDYLLDRFGFQVNFRAQCSQPYPGCNAVFTGSGH